MIGAESTGTVWDVPLYTSRGPEVFPSQILESIPSNLTLEREDLEQYLALLIEEQVTMVTRD